VPALLPVNNVVRIAFHQGYEGATVLNIIHAEYDGSPPDSAALSTFADGAHTAWKDNVLPTISNDLFLQLTVVDDLDAAGGAQGSHASNDAGGDGADNLPANVAVCVSLGFTGARYRGGHPRAYLSGITKDRLSGVKDITGGAASDFQTGFNNFLADLAAVQINGTDVSPALVRRHSHNVILNPPLVLPLTTATVNTRLDSQRRRLGR
jgi:hypothetical protein